LILLDVNVLVYAYREDSDDHRFYKNWLLDVLNGEQVFGLCDAVFSGFLRIVTHPKIYKVPSPLKSALDFVEAIRSHPDSGSSIAVDFSLRTVSSVLFDAVFVPGGNKSVTALSNEPDAQHFVNEAYKHCKAIAVIGDAASFLNGCGLTPDKATGKLVPEEGVINGSSANRAAAADAFVKAVSQHRAWSRENKKGIPA